jgi:hypothetical protein
MAWMQGSWGMGRVTRLDARLSRLEQMARPALQPIVMVFWHEELVPCTAHRGCDAEAGTGAHHKGVIHLSLTETKT